MNQPNYKYKRVPVVLETFSDLETPLSVYLKLADGPYSYLLESSQGGEKWGDTQLLGCRLKRSLLFVENKLKSYMMASSRNPSKHKTLSNLLSLFRIVMKSNIFRNYQVLWRTGWLFWLRCSQICREED